MIGLGLLLMGCALPPGTGTCPTGGALDGASSVPFQILINEPSRLVNPVDGTGAYATRQDWALFTSQWSGLLPEVDFETEQVLAATASVGATCGLTVESFQVVDLGGPHLDLTVFDTSGTCADACDAEGAWTVAVTVSAGSRGSACARIHDVCTR